MIYVSKNNSFNNQIRTSILIEFFFFRERICTFVIV